MRRGADLPPAGADVAVAARTDEQVSEAIALLRDVGRRAFGMACDLRDPDAALGLADAVERGLGPIDVLVNAVDGSAAAPAVGGSCRCCGDRCTTHGTNQLKCHRTTTAALSPPRSCWSGSWPRSRHAPAVAPSPRSRAAIRKRLARGSRLSAVSSAGASPGITWSS
ncbi:MAG: SDR family NAD(P)-dependent oxidoreductase [Chloroflexota bacterium]